MINLNDTKQALEYLASVREVNSEFFVRVPILYKHQNENVRYQTTLLLAKSNEPEAKVYLRELLDDPCPEVSLRATSEYFGTTDTNIEALISSTSTNPEKSARTNKKGLETEVELYNTSDFILIPGTNVKISRKMIVTGKNWMGSNYDLSDNGLHMPRMDIFMKHYKNVLSARMGRCALETEDNKEVSLEEFSAIYHDIIYSKCWLDAHFLGTNLMTDHRVIGTLTAKTRPLLPHLEKGCFARLNSLNEQGLPTLESGKGKRGLFYRQPQHECVASFVSHAGTPCLYCDLPLVYVSTMVGSFGCLDVK